VADTESGDEFLISSTLPLQARTASGGFAPVNLSLLDLGARLEPANSLAPFAIDTMSSARVEFPAPGLAFELAGAADRTAEAASNRAFFAGVEQDTDAAVVPTPTGVELDLQVRSPAGPERFVIDVDLPAGAELLPARSPDPIPNDPPASLVVVRDGRPLAYVHPPIGHDADGQAVPTRMRAQGEQIVIEVDHRDRDLLYPLLVDPEINLYGDYYYDWPGWAWSQQLYGNSGGFGAARNDCNYYCGLYQSHPTHTFNADTSYAHWYVRAPVNTFIYRARLGGMAHSSIYVSGRNHTNWYHGLMNSAYSSWEGNVNYVNQSGAWGPNPFGPAEFNAWGVDHDFCFNPRCDRWQGSETNFVLFGLQTDNKFSGYPDGIYSGDQKATNTMAWAQVYLGDRRAPYLSGGLPGDRGWRDDGGADTTITPSAHDDGLGVYSFSLWNAASGNGTHGLGCTGNPYWQPCRADSSRTLQYRPTEGVSRIYLNARDAVDNVTATHSWLERIDRSAPTIATPSGTLWDARNRDDDRRFGGLYEESYSLRVSASDAHSGLRDIEAFMVGEQGSRTSLGRSASGELTVALRPDDFADGEYTVEVIARDNVQGQPGAPDERHVARRVFPVTVDRRGDVYYAEHVSADIAAGGELLAEEWARIGTKTARREVRDAVSTRTDAPCRDGEPDGPRCPETRYRTLDSQLEGAGADDRDTFVRYRGASADDPNIQQIADVLDPAEFDDGGEEPVTRGSLVDALATWQVPPPAHGGEYELYEFDGRDEQNQGAADETTGEYPGESAEQPYQVRIWIEARTRMPLRQVVTDANGSQTSFWSYSRSRRAVDELSSDFFLVPAPDESNMDQDVQYTGNRSIGQTRDRQTGSDFTPYYFGPSLTLAGQALCFATASVFRHFEPASRDESGADPEATPRDLSDLTRVDADYVSQESGSCGSRQALAEGGQLSVSSVARTSQLAEAYRDAIVPTAQAIQVNPLDGDFASGGVAPFVFGLNPGTAYVVPGDDGGTLALADVGDTTVLASGRFTKNDVPDLFSRLEAR